MLALEQKALFKIVLVIITFIVTNGCICILIWERYKDKEIIECKPIIKKGEENEKL